MSCGSSAQAEGLWLGCWAELCRRQLGVEGTGQTHSQRLPRSGQMPWSWAGDISDAEHRRTWNAKLRAQGRHSLLFCVASRCPLLAAWETQFGVLYWHRPSSHSEQPQEGGAFTVQVLLAT